MAALFSKNDKLSFVGFFDLDINEKSYYNYFHVSLQNEDGFDVYTSGYRKIIEGGLNTGDLRVRFDGS